MAPRILFVDHVGVLGGAEFSLLELGKHFRDTSRVVLFEDGPFSERLKQAGVAAEILPAPGAVTNVTRGGSARKAIRAFPGVMRLAWKLAQRAQGYDLIYANSQKSMIVSAVASTLSGRPVIWHLRDLMTADHFSAVNRHVAVRLANLLAARVIVNSRATREAFIECGGRAGKAHVVYNGIDASRLEAVASEEIDRLRGTLELGEGPLVGAFSRLAPWKGQHVLLEALAQRPGVQALLVGDALFEEDRSYADRLRRRTQELGLSDRVHFLGFREDVPQLMQLVDVVAHTSIAPEPFGRVIVEGMLADRPVVATRAGGALEIIDHNRTGLLVPPDDANALADALDQLLSAPERSEAMAHEGRRMARERFSQARANENVERHVSEVVAN